MEWREGRWDGRKEGMRKERRKEKKKGSRECVAHKCAFMAMNFTENFPNSYRKIPKGEKKFTIKKKIPKGQGDRSLTGLEYRLLSWSPGTKLFTGNFKNNLS